MDTNNIREITGLLTMPFDIIVGISEHLDLCSNTSLMDTCKQMRYLYLSSKYLWRRIVFDLDHSNLSKIYSSLRKLDDSNGLRENVTDVGHLFLSFFLPFSHC